MAISTEMVVERDSVSSMPAKRGTQLMAVLLYEPSDNINEVTSKNMR